MFSDRELTSFYLERDERVILLTELRAIFISAQNRGSKNPEKMYPKLSELKTKLDFLHNTP